MHTFFNPNAPFPTWQQFLKRPDNIGLNVMQAKQKYLTEQTNYYRMIPPTPSFAAAAGGAGSTDTGPTFTNTNSLNFDNIDDVITFSGNTPSGFKTLSVWVNMTSTALSENNYIFSRSVGSVGSDYLLWVGSSVYVRNGGFRQFTNVETEIASIGADTWFHIALTISAAGSGTCTFFINGQPIQTIAGVGGSEFDFQRIGSGYHPSLRRAFGGNLDEISGFDTILSNDDILNELYNNGKPKDISSLNPTMWLRMGDLSDGTTISNQGSATIDDGTISGPTIQTNVPS